MSDGFMRRCAAIWIALSAPLTLAACYASGSFIEFPNYQHYYFYTPSVTNSSSSAIKVKQDGRTIDLAFEGSGNIFSITTVASRGDQGFIWGSPGKAATYSGSLAFDAARSYGERIPMRLWVAASCVAEDWAILPSRLRIVDPSRNSSDIPLDVYLQPMPAVLHPDTQVFTGHWQYTQLDSNREIRCEKGGTVAFTIGFEMNLMIDHPKIIFADSLRGDGKALHIPDIDLSLTSGETLVSTKRVSIIEMLFRAIPVRY